MLPTPRVQLLENYTTDWNSLEKIWHHVLYNELRVVPEEHPVLLIDQPLQPKTNREKTIEIMFETFNVPATYISMSAELALYASARMSGVVVECGAGSTYAVPIYEGSVLLHAIMKMDVAGDDLSEYMRR